MPDVRHFVPNLERDVDTRGASLFGEARRVVQQRLGVADLQQQRRQAAEVGMQRGGQRTLRVGVAQIELRHAEQPFFLHHGIDRGARRHGFPGAFHVHPRGDADTRGRQRLAGVAQGEQRRNRQPAPSRVAGDGDVAWADALGEQPTIRGHSVVHRCRKGMLGCQAVVERQYAGAGGLRQAAGHVAVRTRGTHHVAAAVHVQDDLGFVHARGRAPFRGHAAGVHRHTGDAVRGLRLDHDRAHVVHVLRLDHLGAHLLEHVDGLLQLLARHSLCSFGCLMCGDSRFVRA